MNFQKTFVIAIFGYSKKPWLMNFICENVCGISFLMFYHHLGEQGEVNGGAPDDDDGPGDLYDLFRKHYFRNIFQGLEIHP